MKSIREWFAFRELVWNGCGLMMVVSRFTVRHCYCCGEEVVCNDEWRLRLGVAEHVVTMKLQSKA